MAERCPFPVTFYLVLSRLAAPIYRLVHLIRCRRGKDDPERSGEKFGFASIARPSESLVWLHAASVGETISVLPLIEALTADHQRVLLTTITRTAAEIAAKRLPDGAFHQYAPFDNQDYWDRFLDAWMPDLAIMVESEVWPACFESVRRRDRPLCLVNGRMSEGSFKNWSRFPESAHHIFQALDLALAQSSADARRLRALGCRVVEEPGNLKFDAMPERPEAERIRNLSGMFEGRPVWLAALTHPGEEEIVLASHRALLAKNPDLLLMLVPRHPARAEEVFKAIEQIGLNGVRRSVGGRILPSTQVYLGDTLGEMSLFYEVADVAFLGGSFVEVGGHNPVEAASLGTAIITGPKVANARTVYKSLWQAGGALRVDKADALSDAVAGLMQDHAERNRQIEVAREIIENGRGALQRTLAFLQPYLPPSGAADTGGEGQ
ncbi:3-deoxy-D-manno-octulosonic acid transferase [Labrenzia sp. CE80]|uniref:3-deoxy-D-manno-octulosonic acid transferase n=1 Tax=Labrenzia sp. CE80 TaxID=1788986 RepID=UPI00129A56B2|nr:3-deoxy-D-manno-octulosonic acid transferase [Labrenzia sp. CE80]